jgi:hypothetical protein
MSAFSDLIPSGTKNYSGAFSDLVPSNTSQAPVQPAQPQQSFADQLWQSLSQPNIPSMVGSAIKSGVKNILSAPQTIADQFGSGVSQVKQGASEIARGGSPLQGAESGLKVESGIASAVSAPLAPLFKPVGDAIQSVAGAVGSIPAVQDFANSNAGKATSRIAEDLSNAGNVAGTIAGVDQAVKQIPSGLVKKGIDAVNGLSPEQQAAKEAQMAVAKQSALEKIAIKDATPAYNKSLIGDGRSTVSVKNPDGTTTQVPRIQEGKGVTGGRTVTSTETEIAAGKELVQVPGYAQAKTALEKYNTVEPAIAAEAKALRASLKEEKILRPPQEVLKVIKDAVGTASKDSLLLQKSDPIVKNYLRVAERAIAQSDGTLDGELSVRQILDNAYEDAGGKYSNNKGLDQIHRAARDALTTDVESKSVSTEVKASLRKQTNLYRAADVLLDKAKAEGGSKLEQTMKAHPTATKVVTGAAKAAGLGAGLHLIP